MPDLETKWAIDCFSSYYKPFKEVFGYNLVLGKCEDNANKVMSLCGCVASCIESKDDANYIMKAFEDYESYFGTRVYIPEPNGTKQLIFKIMQEAYRVDCDYLSLYYKGVKLSTLDILSMDLVGNDANLSDVDDSEFEFNWSE